MSYFQDLYQQWQEFPRTIKLFYVSDVFFGLGMAVFNTLFNLHLLSAGYTPNDIGSLQSLSSLLFAVVSIPVGILCDRFGRRGLYVAGSLLFAAPYLLIPLLTNFSILVAVYAVGTLGSIMMFVTESPLLAAEVDSRQRSSVFSFMFMNFFIWNTVGTQLAGLLPNWLPAGATSKYEWPLVLGGLFGVAGGVYRLFLRFRPQPSAKVRLKLRPSRTTLLLTAVSLLTGAFGALVFNFTNVVLDRRFGLGSGAIASVLAVGGVLGWVGSLFVPLTTRHIGSRKALALVFVSQGIALGLMGLANVPALFMPALWARSVVGTMQMSLWSAFSMNVTAADERATANSYMIVGRNIGMAVMSKVYGAAIASGAFLLAHGLSGALAVCTALLSVLLFRETKVEDDGVDSV